MLRDHAIPKPPTLQGYTLHRHVQGLMGGESPLFVDMGDRLLVRTELQLTATGVPPRAVGAGGLAAFELRACVSRKVKGRHRYFPPADWRSRHDWLRRQGERLGFQPLTVHCRAGLMKVEKQGAPPFTVDRTDFTGVLRVTDEEAFARAVAGGVGSTARAFGFGMLLL